MQYNLILIFCAVLLAQAFAGAPPGPSKAYNDAGYIDFENEGGERHLFYWFFESENDPVNDPFVIWMTGGPGCSGLLALFGENGPYIVQEDLSLKENPYSWNKYATVLWIDQPVGTGFSYGEPPIIDEAQMASDMWKFIQLFFQKYPKYSNLPLFIFGESYAGHYVPALSAKIVDEIKQGALLNYKGSAIGNGLTDPLVQFRYYVQYIKANNGTTALRISKAELDIMEAFLPMCDALIAGCNKANQTEEKWLLCINSYVMCSYSQMLPVQLSGVNLYDVREKCDPGLPLCYNFTLTTDYLNQPAVKAALNTTGRHWSTCNRLVDLVMAYAGDWMVDYQGDVEKVLDSGYRFMLYAGEWDFICNWMGNFAWSTQFDWHGKAAYDSAPNNTWVVDGAAAGMVKTADSLTFVKVNGAGHMVPKDQPKNALDLFYRFIANKPFA